MLVAHLSDLHVFSSQPETYQVRRDIVSVVSRIVADLTNLPIRPDAVFITGDVADGGSEADYALVRSLLAPLKMPVLVIPGNHDRRQTMRAAFADLVPFAPGAFLNFATSIGDFEVIGLDTMIPGKVEGELCDTRLDWLEHELSLRQSLTFLLMHHPAWPSGNAQWDATALVRGGSKLGAILGKAQVPLRILSGHVHQAMHGSWNGHYAAIGGSPAFTYDFGIAATQEPPLLDQPYSYFLHHKRTDGSIGVHCRYVQLSGT